MSDIFVVAAVRTGIGTFGGSLRNFEPGDLAARVPAQAISLGDCEIAVAGGAEAMSRAPYFASFVRWGNKLGDATLVDGLNGALTDPFEQILMGVTAENVAERYGVTRSQQGHWSHSRHKAGPRAPPP
jgi:acetyl-CoA C-acetyltransferase